jgi:hypothetical protein
MGYEIIMTAQLEADAGARVPEAGRKSVRRASFPAACDPGTMTADPPNVCNGIRRYGAP